MATLVSLVVASIPAKLPTSSWTKERTCHRNLRFSLLSGFLVICTSSKRFLSPLKAAPPRKYVYPDPIPEFAVSETKKFRDELKKRLLEDVEELGDELEAVVEICAEVLGKFLHEDYGGPGTLLVEPFTDMLVALKKKKLPGAPLAARASLLWAQSHLDQDWLVWNSKPQS